MCSCGFEVLGEYDEIIDGIICEMCGATLKRSAELILGTVGQSV